MYTHGHGSCLVYEYHITCKPW